MEKSNIYKDFFSPSEEVSLKEIFETIKNEKYKSQISSIQYALHSGKEDLSQTLKKELPAFTPSGTFKERRKIENLIYHSGIIHLDIDGLEPHEVTPTKEKINNCPFTWVSFVSPRGGGLKVFIKAEVNKETHREVWQKLDDHYSEIIGFRTDNKCKDVSRLCFVSSDPELFLNEQCEVFKWNTVNNEKPIAMTDDKLESCKEFTEKREHYAKGNRNNFIHLFACNANRYGIDKEEALQYCISTFDLDDREIKSTFNSVYNNNSHEFAKFASFANTNSVIEGKTEKEESQMEDILKNTPCIPGKVYNNLPDLLKRTSQMFDDIREKDVFLTSAISILSGCLPNVSGLYFDSSVYPNLFSFILAPPASGKGAMNQAKILGDKIHESLKEMSKESLKEYQANLKAYKNAKGNTDQQEPEKPPFQVLFIPANVSSAKVYEHLQHNGGKGIICETEADTLGTVFKNEWGSYSDLLRKAFHHERVSISRKTDGLFLEVEEPKLSVVLTGTPNQIVSIIPSAEDGLFSRFLFYTFGADPVWKSPAPKPGRPNLKTFFQKQASIVKKMKEMLTLNPTEMVFSKEQWEKFDLLFTDLLDEVNKLISSEATSIVKRLGLMLFKICMIFTAIRKFENGDASSKITCEDTDFDNASEIIKILVEHSIILYTNLPGAEKEFKITKE
ncbi:MAG: DUF3987 domain-containing protein, partial [Bacteroidota bacterium]